MSELPYDGDLNDPKQRCRHGTFIGSWWGPDYLCLQCELGDEYGDEPPTVPMCDHEDRGPDYDGTTATFPCGAEARHTLVSEDALGQTWNHLCPKHLHLWLTDCTEQDDRLYLDPNTTIDQVFIGRIVMPDDEGSVTTE